LLKEKSEYLHPPMKRLLGTELRYVGEVWLSPLWIGPLCLWNQGPHDLTACLTEDLPTGLGSAVRFASSDLE
jgi:hypothetical protein